MLDPQKVGINISTMRKKVGYSQEKLAEQLCISPQAISKWENGHSLPETSLLPVLSQIFGCSIDEIIKSAYDFDEKIEEGKPTVLEQQAEHIAKHIIQNLKGKITPKETLDFDDKDIIDSIYKANGNIGYCMVKREKPVKSDGNTLTSITVTAPQKIFKLIAKRYGRNDSELYRYKFLSGYTTAVPQLYLVDFDKNTVLMEDLNVGYIQGYDFDEKNEFGEIIRSNYNTILAATAKLHAFFWENYQAFKQIGLDWRLESKENLLAHISAMEKDYKKYRKNEDAGKIPKVWEGLENNIEKARLDCFEDAINYLKVEYVKLIDSRFHTGKNITIIHGDLHPGQTFLSKSTERNVKYFGLQAVRIGVCTEDLAMLLALHIEPEKQKVQVLLDYYYQCLCKNIKDYPYETFINDYKISIAENMFFTIRLINRGIFAFNMRDNSIKAFETFVLSR